MLLLLLLGEVELTVFISDIFMMESNNTSCRCVHCHSLPLFCKHYRIFLFALHSCKLFHIL